MLCFGNGRERKKIQMEAWDNELEEESHDSESMQDDVPLGTSIDIILVKVVEDQEIDF